ncbi:hypothetical protein Taro_027330 [Colocasia esculenta]|uniref:Bifunctional inhibitor/plant lipid transfer protein/seed storage helical domain-containing protein n=1 Tax=Colocasia esculenta TaxID=4460 RepID=A0A843VNF9_COLES|nr:hypothetical protein [Colocasia esculenta]
MEKQLFALVAATAVLLVVAATMTKAVEADGPAAPVLCGMTQKGLEACQPAVTGKTGATATAPSAACCTALAAADLSCLCKFKNDNAKLLKSLNIDPKVATKLPAKCQLHPRPSTTGENSPMPKSVDCRGLKERSSLVKVLGKWDGSSLNDAEKGTPVGALGGELRVEGFYS